jgi:hypothetical protein
MVSKSDDSRTGSGTAISFKAGFDCGCKCLWYFTADVADNERSWIILGPPFGQIMIFFDSATKSFNHQTS